MFLCLHCPFWLSAFCFFLPLLCDTFCAVEEGHAAQPTQNSSPSRRRLRSRPRDFRFECVAGFRERIEFHCQFPDTEKPCLRDYAEDSVTHLDGLASECCASDRLCSLDDIEALCCRTMDCLALCYGQSFLARIQSRFRYADILLKRHANGGESRRRGRRGAAGGMRGRGGEEEETEEEKREEEEHNDNANANGRQ